MLNIVTMIMLTVRELEKWYGMEGMVDAKIIDASSKVIMVIQDIKKVLQDYEDHHACTCKEYWGKWCKCKNAKVFDLKGKTVDGWRKILDNWAAQAYITCREFSYTAPDKYKDKWKVSMLNIVTMIMLTVRELEKWYGMEGMVDAKIIDASSKVIMVIQDIKKVLQDYEDHHACTCKEYWGKWCKCKNAKVFDLKGKTVDGWRKILDNWIISCLYHIRYILSDFYKNPNVVLLHYFSERTQIWYRLLD